MRPFKFEVLVIGSLVELQLKIKSLSHVNTAESPRKEIEKRAQNGTV